MPLIFNVQSSLPVHFFFRGRIMRVHIMCLTEKTWMLAQLLPAELLLMPRRA